MINIISILLACSSKSESPNDTQSEVTPTWIVSLGSNNIDVGRGIAISPDGNYIYITGYTEGALAGYSHIGGKDAFIAVYDANGNEIWIKQIATSADEEGYSIAVSPDAIYVAGYTEGLLNGEANKNRDAFIIKYNFDSNRVWTRLLGSDYDDTARGVAVSPDGNGIYITGEANGDILSATNKGYDDVLIAKYSNAGTLQWVKLLSTTAFDRGWDIITSNNGNYIYIVGDTEGTFEGNVKFGGFDAFIAKYDHVGNKIWVRQLGSAFDDVAYGIAVTPDDAFVYLIGEAKGAVDGHPSFGGYDILIAKYDANGNKLAVSLLGSTATTNGYNNDTGMAVVVSPNDSHFYIAGYVEGDLNDQSNQGNGYADGFIVAYDNNFNILWTKLIGSTSYDTFEDMVISPDGNYLYAVGAFSGDINNLQPKGSDDVLLYKVPTTMR